jgi:CRP-like cAMP-binding protein
VVVDILRGGDVDGDIALFLEMPMAYTARALNDSTCLYLDRAAFENLVATHPNIARRWLSSVAQRVSAGQDRLVALLGRPLPARRSRNCCSTNPLTGQCSWRSVRSPPCLVCSVPA